MTNQNEKTLTQDDGVWSDAEGMVWVPQNTIIAAYRSGRDEGEHLEATFPSASSSVDVLTYEEAREQWGIEMGRAENAEARIVAALTKMDESTYGDPEVPLLMRGELTGLGYDTYQDTDAYKEAHEA